MSEEMNMDDRMLDIVKDIRNRVIALRSNMDDISYWLVEASGMDGVGDRLPVEDRIRVMRMLNIMQMASADIVDTLYRVIGIGKEEGE